ncbi:MAG: SDR family NAD(P)-dependent oxidoreductase [Anaerolineales bacterium]
MRFENRVVMVTGASVGIGKASALAFAREGAKVAIVDVDEKQGKVSADEVDNQAGQGLLIHADVSKEEDVRRSMADIHERWGDLDVLVNNAGIYRQGMADDTPTEEWLQVLGVNLTGPFLCTKHAIPSMVRKGGGVIVNVASEAGLVGIGNQVAYNVSKGGVIALTRSCAVDLAERGIRVNAVCPGTTQTPLVEEAVNRAEDPEAARRGLEEIRPLNRLGDPSEIASAILYLASDDAAYATGSIFSMDGGYTAQ